MTTIGPGTRVECINDNWQFAAAAATGNPTPPNWPIKGGTYTVENLSQRSYENYIRLREFPPRECGALNWNINHFRPIDEDSTDISALIEAHDRGMRGEEVDDLVST